MKILSLMSAVMAAAGLLAVTQVTAQQRYPWNGKVDIVVTMSGVSNIVAKATCIFTATNSATQAALAMKSVTETGTGPVAAGTETWTRRYVWDAIADVGEVQIADVAISVEVTLGGVQLWKDGPYWAECNVGASKPEEYGYYFWWGDTVGYKQDGGIWTDDYYYSGVTWVSSTGERMSESPFVEETCPTMNKDVSELQSLGYIDSTGKLVAEHDAATAHLGAPWRMPTSAEIDALISNCTTTWTTRNGVYGRLVTGTGDYASKSIFLPAASTGSGTNIRYAGFVGGCWPSTPVSSGSNWYSMTISSGSDYVWCLYFHSGTFERNYDYRYRGRSVRPLREFAQ